MMRIAKYLAHAGVASRRHAEKLVEQGTVSINGVVVRNVATQIDEVNDIVEYNKQRIAIEKHVYYLINKPIGYVSSAKDSHNDKLVTDLVPKTPRVYPVGRLDKESSGLMILTNDGDLALTLTHPRYTVSKIYEVTLANPVSERIIKILKKGIQMEEGTARVDRIQLLSQKKVRIALHQGWKRQIRRMFEALGFEVTKLVRVSEGGASLGALKPGEYKKVTRSQIHE